MPSTSDAQAFQQSWQQTAAWAQSKGIKYNQYYPVYQLDSQRYLQYGVSGQMSTAERERAIQAAADPNVSNQATPSTSANPWNIVGNTITDARNIFTGLGDIAAHPLHNGLVDSVKNTFDLIDGSHKLVGASTADKVADALTSTVLSWVPGAADVGTLMEADNTFNPAELLFNPKGLAAEAQHPVSTILDILPLLSKAAALKVAADPLFAAKAGMTVEEGSGGLLKTPKAYMGGSDTAKTISLGRVAKGLMMNKKVGRLGENGELIKGKLNPSTGELMTVGDRLHAMTGGSMLNLSPTIADGMEGGEQVLNHWNNVQRFMTADLEETMGSMTESQKGQLADVLYKSQKVGLDEAIKSVTDPRVGEALKGWLEQNQWIHEESLNAEKGIVKVHNIRTGQDGYFSLKGHVTVLSARDAAQAAEDDLLEVLPGMETLADQSKQASQFVDQSSASLEQANQAARLVHVEGNVAKLLPGDKKEAGVIGRHIPGYQRVKRATEFPSGIAKAKVAKQIFGTGGWVDRLLTKAKAGEYLSVEETAQDTLKKLDNWSEKSVGTGEADPPEFAAVRQQVDNLLKSTQALLKARKEASKAIYGRVEKIESEGKARDAEYKAQSDALSRTHGYQRGSLARAQRDDLRRLHDAFNAKRREISTRYAKARSDRDNTLADGNRNIDERYNLEIAKARTAHLLARETYQEWKRGRTAQGFPETPDIAPGAAGSPEAIGASERLLNAQRDTEKANLANSLPSRAELVAKEKAEKSVADKSETEMTSKLKDSQKADTKALEAKQAQERQNFDTQNKGKPAKDGTFSVKLQRYRETQAAFSDALFKHPSDNFEPVWFDLFAKNLLEDYRAKESLDYKAKVMAGAGEDHLEQLRSNQQVMATLVQLGIHDSMDDPIFDDLDRGLIEHAQNSAYQALDDMAKEGLNPMWIHHVSSTQIENDAKGSAGIRLIVGKGEPNPDVLKPRVWGFNSSKFDIQAAITHPMRQFLSNAALKDFVETYLSKHVVTAEDLLKTMSERFPSQIAGLDRQGLTDFFTEKMKDMNLEEFDTDSRFGFKVAKWGEGKVYLDKDLIRAVSKISSSEGFLKGGIIEKGTKLFRFSILGLSPRYTAHIVFGGSFLMALREPLAFRQTAQMLSDMRSGQVDEDTVRTPTNMGTSEWQIQSTPKKLAIWHKKGGQDTAHYLVQSDLADKGIDWRKASPIQRMKSLADINLRFTSTVVAMQRTLVQLEGAAQAVARGTYTDVTTGEVLRMTPDRAAYEGMKNAERVFGNLKRMSPFERDVARTVMPFYGWTKHILNYVMTFPADHPWRAMMLANMAEFDTASSPGGLPSRYQFLFFLGTPDAQGNVTAIDTRAINPLRDVANYATWAGLIGSLNPAITSVVAMIDPDIIYGGNTLYPNLTYDQFYGIEEAGPQGNILTGAEQFVPQIGGMQSALQLAGSRQGMDDSTLLKSIGEQMNFPWVPQHINLRQEAAKTAMAEYHVSSQLAQNAWQTGNFQPIADLGSVPDPNNPDYETSVSALEQLYNTLKEEYPGQAPSDTAPSLPSVHLG